MGFGVKQACAGIALAVVLAGCSGGGGGSTPVGEMEVQNAQDVIDQADAAFADSVIAGLDGTTTSGDDTRCFFAGAEASATQIMCGPLRELGSDQGAWYSSPVTRKANRDGIVLSLASADQWSEGEAGDGLTRPDGAEPADVAALPEPAAPPFPESNIARLLPEDSLDADVAWDELAEPATVHAPSATITATASARLEQIPAALAGGPEEETAEGSSPAPFYAPADGQSVSVWKVELSASTISGPGAEGWSDSEGRDASARLAVTSGEQRLPVEGSAQSGLGDGSSEGEAFRVACDDGLPCPENSGRYVLLISASADSDPELIVSTDGADQVLNLASGEIASSVSALAEQRGELTMRASTTWPKETYTILTEDEGEEQDLDIYDDVTLAYAGQVTTVYLSPFERNAGWAEADRAWLIVPIEDDPQDLEWSADDLSYDRAKTYTLEVGKETLTPAEGVGSEDTIVFDVPADFTQGTFNYLPTGTVVVDDSPVSFTADETFTLDIAFEE